MHGGDALYLSPPSAPAVSKSTVGRKWVETWAGLGTHPLDPSSKEREKEEERKKDIERGRKKEANDNGVFLKSDGLQWVRCLVFRGVFVDLLGVLNFLF